MPILLVHLTLLFLFICPYYFRTLFSTQLCSYCYHIFLFPNYFLLIEPTSQHILSSEIFLQHSPSSVHSQLMPMFASIQHHWEYSTFRYAHFPLLDISFSVHTFLNATSTITPLPTLCLFSSIIVPFAAMFPLGCLKHCTSSWFSPFRLTSQQTYLQCQT